MLKMILADDEPVITMGIQKLVDWQQLGVEIVGVYDNGKNALQGILEMQPDIAVLDISMPGKTGLEILKVLSGAKSPTKVVFLSGFQDFEFAQTALRYGAMDYLLKPVKKENLIAAVRKCAVKAKQGAISETAPPTPEDSFLPPEVYQKLAEAENVNYTLCTAELFGAENGSSMEQQLALFSALDRVEEYLGQTGGGIAFQQEGRVWLVLTVQNPKQYLQAMQTGLLPGCSLGFVYGEQTDKISSVKTGQEACIDTAGYFYYQSMLPHLVLKAGRPVFDDPCTDSRLKQIRDEIVTSIFEQKQDEMESKVKDYLRCACTISGSKSDTATYYLLSCIRAVEERFETLDAPLKVSNIVDTMDKARQTVRYAQMEAAFTELMQHYYAQVSEMMQSGDKKYIMQAKSYIEEHYAENLTLEVLAKHIHMNPFYFSSFFKKQTGENFKDYLNKTRMKRGVELVVMTDKKIYEIAEEVGFKDYRYFTELFNRTYGKTPMAYRKDLAKDKPPALTHKGFN